MSGGEISCTSGAFPIPRFLYPTTTTTTTKTTKCPGMLYEVPCACLQSAPFLYPAHCPPLTCFLPHRLAFSGHFIGGKRIILEKVEHTLRGHVRWRSAVEDSLTGAHDIKHRIPLRCSNSAPRYTPKQMESKSAHRSGYVSAHSSPLHDSPNVGRPKSPSVDERVGCQEMFG